MSDLANATDVIFDARSYPRIEPTDLLVHLTDVPLRPPLLSVPIGTRPDHRDMRFASVTWTLEPQRPRIRGRCVFLIDERDVSAGETFVGIVEAYHMGDLIGSNTAGTNGNVYTATQLPGDYQLLWTRMKVLKHDGSRLHGVGYAPNVPVSPTIRGTAEGRDEVLERAIELLRSRRSAALAQ
jgi:C-terminal processing protease CtpA/Prc